MKKIIGILVICLIIAPLPAGFIYPKNVSEHEQLVLGEVRAYLETKNTPLHQSN